MAPAASAAGLFRRSCCQLPITAAAPSPFLSLRQHDAMSVAAQRQASSQHVHCAVGIVIAASPGHFLSAWGVGELSAWVCVCGGGGEGGSSVPTHVVFMLLSGAPLAASHVVWCALDLGLCLLIQRAWALDGGASCAACTFCALSGGMLAHCSSGCQHPACDSGLEVLFSLVCV
jgi:hypothetical protein